MKRKLNEEDKSPAKKRNVTTNGSIDLKSTFRPDLFENQTVEAFRESYKVAGPYPHAVVPSLIQEPLLRSVRSEIISHIHFTLKETDIYRIHQSGDLANLSNLDADSLKQLPNLVRLRDALYSSEFREWVSTVTGAGKVSGRKTDMAVNVYTPGSYLLCHDDVIGSRRVSYILYLTDPDHPWQPEWGGGLRLFPTEIKKNKAGEDIKVPLAEHSLTIPPAFGQLSFFAVRPGESYHDVEEVYYGPNLEADGGRIRMAISGWFHIPQEGEDGFEEGIEQAQAQRSSLAQLKSAATEFDEPQLIFRHFDEPRTVMDSHALKKELDPGDDQDNEEDELTEQDLTFLLHYISPSYLTPDMIEEFSASFAEMSVLQLEQFFSSKFAAELKEYISKVESEGPDAAASSHSKSHPSNWAVARPPQKHRFAYLQGAEALHRDKTPISRILTDLLHSHAFKKWLALVTGFRTKGLVRQNMIARRFRRGKDYALANPYLGQQPQLEFTISITPSEGWERDVDDDNDSEVDAETGNVQSHGRGKTRPGAAAPSASAPANGDESKGKGKGKAPEVEKVQVTTSEEIEFGGEEVYMAGDDDEDDDKASVHSKSLPSVGKKADPAIYKSSTGEDEDDGILFANPAAWNRFSVVLRDKGTLRFVKYVSQAATGDRWDIKGEVEVEEDAWDDEEEDGGEHEGEAGPIRGHGVGEAEIETETETEDDGEDSSEEEDDE